MTHFHLPPPTEGNEYARRVINREEYLTTGLFPIGSPRHTLEELVACPALSFDFDLADYIKAEMLPDNTVREIKEMMYGLDRTDVEDLLEAQLDVIISTFSALRITPSTIVMSGYGFHVYLWTECGGEDIDRMRRANRWLISRLNEIAGFELADSSAKDAGTRILRPPGTFNCKGEEPVEVTLLDSTGVLYPVPANVPDVSNSRNSPSRNNNTSSPFAGISSALPANRRNFSEVRLVDRWTECGYETLRDLCDHELDENGSHIRLQCPFHNGTSTDSAFLTRNDAGQPYLVCTSASDGLTYWDNEWIPPMQEPQVVAALTTTRQGGFRNNLENTVTILTLDSRWTDRLWYNERSHTDMIDEEQLVDAHVAEIRIWISQHYGFEPGKDRMFDAVTVVTHRNRRNALTDWLDSLEWDGTNRIDTWMERTFDCESSEYYRSVARKFLISACARAYQPGCKVDTVLLLIGEQGLGKSTLLRTLAGDPWFGDTELQLNSKDAYLVLARAWIYEIAELTSFRRSDAEKVKAFITSQVDSIRKPFARKAENYPRHTCIVATSNDETPLTDPTGSRRFWPVKMQEYADLDWLRANRGQIWAEARDAFKAGEVWHLSREMEAEQKRIAEERFTEEDPVLGVLAKWLERPGYDVFTLTDVYQKGLAGATVSSMRVSRLLRHLGAAPLKRRRAENTRVSQWIKPGIRLPDDCEYKDINAAREHIRTLNQVIELAPIREQD